MEFLQIALATLCLLNALWLLVLVVRDRTPDRLALTTAGVVEVGLIGHLVLGVVRVTSEATDVAAWEYVGYLVGALLVIPAGIIWAGGERSRGGTTVLLVAMLVVPFMFVRLADIWAAGA